MIILGTEVVHEDDPAWGLVEKNLNHHDGTKHRYQILSIMKYGEPYECRKDLGPAGNFKANQFGIAGGVFENGVYDIVETAGRLLEMADQLRSAPSYTTMGFGNELLAGYQILEERRLKNANCN